MSLKEPLMYISCPKMILLGLFGYKQTFFTPKVDQIIKDSNEIFLGVKSYVFWEMTPNLPYLMSLL